MLTLWSTSNQGKHKPYCVSTHVLLCMWDKLNYIEKMCTIDMKIDVPWTLVNQKPMWRLGLFDDARVDVCPEWHDSWRQDDSFFLDGNDCKKNFWPILCNEKKNCPISIQRKRPHLFAHSVQHKFWCKMTSSATQTLNPDNFTIDRVWLMSRIGTKWLKISSDQVSGDRSRQKSK